VAQSGYIVRKSQSQRASSGVVIDASGLDALGKALKQEGYKEIYKVIQVHLKELGELLEDRAKMEARQYSSSIPHTITHKVRGTSVSLIAGVKKAEQERGRGAKSGHKGYHAAAFESAKRGSFRHPVWPQGDDRSKWHWTKRNQQGHPFLGPTIARSRPDIAAAIEESIKIGMRPFGFE